ncbi:MAG: DEAD/DEAH box helicase family protein, partial [Candidatus Hodarchaeales archaeon]
MKGASITEEAWINFITAEKSEFQITIQEDLSFLIDFPWYPFTQINAWIPIRRSHYKKERSRSLNVEDYFEYLKKEEEPEDYDRKFFYYPWIGEQFRIWERNWRKHNSYWEHKRTHRPTKFILQFPHLVQEDIKLLQKTGVTIKYSPGTKEKLDSLSESGHQDYSIVVESVDDKLRIKWNKAFNTWFHTLFDIFSRYMAIRSEDDPNSDYLHCITQVEEREIEVAYWAAFRANHFWRMVEKSLAESQARALFDLKFTPFSPTPSKKIWKTEMLHNYELRSYQQTGIEKWFENQEFGTIQLPTGAGKTIIGIDAIRQIQQRTLILVPNLALVDQWIDQIGKFIGVKPSDIGIFTGQKKAFRQYQIV